MISRDRSLASDLVEAGNSNVGETVLSGYEYVVCKN